MATSYIVTSTTSLWVKAEASQDAEDINTLASGSVIAVTATNGDWCQFSDGWVYSKDSSGNTVLETTGESSSTTSATSSSTSTAKTSLSYTEVMKELQEQSAGITSDSDFLSQLDGLTVKSLKGIHGMPYQFMAIADRRIDSAANSFGRKYADKIVARMPLLLMTPGNPEFLTKFSDSERKGVVEYIVGLASGNSAQSDLDEILKREGRYYTLKPNYPEYYNHVNPMCRAAASFLDIGDITLDGTKLKNYEWSNNANSDLHKYLSYKGASAFYIQSETQITESFSNNTSESMLANKSNQLSDMGREINFLLGGASSMTGMTLDKYTSMTNLSTNIQNTQDLTKNLLNGGSQNFMKSIMGGMQTVIAGGKLIFPEIWSDSNFSNSYDISMKLTTPDCDKLSWYYNICVPMMHLIGFVAPKQSGVNGYISPFLVRAFYKGLFNCNMGIITHMSFNKGAEGAWTKDGLPTIVDVNFTIKDLYSTMAITSNKDIKYGLMNNIALLDYIANACGVNICEPDIVRLIDMYYTQNLQNKITDKVLLDIAGGFDQWATNKVMSLYGRK